MQLQLNAAKVPRYTGEMQSNLPALEVHFKTMQVQLNAAKVLCYADEIQSNAAAVQGAI